MIELPKVSKHLFDNDGWTREADKFGIEIEEILKPIFEQRAKEGYSLRELAYIVHQAVDHASITTVLMSKGRHHNAQRET